MRHDDKADLYDLSVLHNEVHRRAAAAGLAVRFKDDLPSAGTDGKNIFIPRLKQPVTRTQLTKLRGQVIHEVGHINRKQAFNILRTHKIAGGTPIAELFNTVEDEVMERQVAGEYVGDAGSLAEGHNIHIRDQIQTIMPMVNGLATVEDEMTRNLAAAYCVAQGTREWDHTSRAARELLEDIMPPDVRKLAADLRKEGWDRRIAKANTVDESWEVSKGLLKRLFPNEPEPQPQAGEGEGEGQQGEGQGKPTNAPAQGKGQPGQAEKGKNDQATKDKLHWSMLKHSEHDDFENTGKQGAGVDWRGYSGAWADPQFLPRQFKPNPPPKAPPSASTLAGKLRIWVQSKNKAKMIYDQPSGKLNKRKLGLLGMPVVPGSTAHKRAFKKRVVGKKINTCCHILVDCSGSMYGEKQDIAAKSADKLCTALANALRIKTAVTGFGGSGSGVSLWPVKRFNDPPVPGVISGLSGGAAGGGNADGDAVMYAIDTLVPRREARKMLIVLSDGMPSSCAPGIDPAAMLKASIATAKKRGIELYGVGIQDDSVKIFYGQNTKVIRSLEEFDAALLTTLSGSLV